MDKKELQLLGKQRDNLISSLYASYEATLSKAQGVLFKQFAVEIMDKLEYDEDGKVINNAKNRNVLVSLDKFFKKWNDDTNPRVLNVLLDGVQQIMNFNYGYYSKFNEVPKASLIKLREKALSNVRGWLGMEDNEIKPNGYLDTLVSNDTVKNQIKDALMKTIYSQDGWNSAKKVLQTIIEGDGSGSLGSLEKYHRNFSYDLYSQIDRATGKTYADDLGFEFAIYEGGIIETSRQFCIDHNGNVYHISEIKKMKPEKAIPPNYNPLFDMGGHGCRHHWNWIPKSLALVLRPDAKKFVDGSNVAEPAPTKPTETPKQKPQTTKKEPKKVIEVQPIEKQPKSKIEAITKPSHAREELMKIIPNAKKISISANDMSIDTIKNKVSTINDLFSEYKVFAESIDEVKFATTKTAYGSVQWYANKNIKKINFGSRTDPYKDRQRYDDPELNLKRGKSVVDEKNTELSTVVHEFAHVLMTDRRSVAFKDEKMPEFITELTALRTDYFKEINGYLSNKQRDKAADIYLGKYASSNVNEFMAEGWTEYKLSSKPSKYATKIGKLIDKYFKK